MPFRWYSVRVPSSFDGTAATRPVHEQEPLTTRAPAESKSARLDRPGYVSQVPPETEAAFPVAEKLIREMRGADHQVGRAAPTRPRGR